MDLITMVLACSLYADNSITNAMVQVGSQNQPFAIAVDGGTPKNFKSQSEALSYANKQISAGHTVDIGLMQIPSTWLKAYHVTVADILMPCKNMVIGTEILYHSEAKCDELQPTIPNLDVKTCALSMYHTGDPQAGADYANAILTYAKQHNFDDIVAAAKAKNPAEFEMLPGDAATTVSTPDADQVNPSTDPTQRHG
jgi:type IV secretion system protein VirB1